MSTEIKHYWLMGAAVGFAFGLLVGSQISSSVVTNIMRKQAIYHGHAIYNPTNGEFMWREREPEKPVDSWAEENHLGLDRRSFIYGGVATAYMITQGSNITHNIGEQAWPYFLKLDKEFRSNTNKP